MQAAAATHGGADILDTLRRRAELPGSGGLQDDFTLLVVQG